MENEAPEAAAPSIRVLVREQWPIGNRPSTPFAEQSFFFEFQVPHTGPNICLQEISYSIAENENS